jgi:cardiolipin synthase A/B
VNYWGDEHRSAVGSLNGSEISHKLHREVMLLTPMPGVFQRLVEVFLWDGALLAPLTTRP